LQKTITYRNENSDDVLKAKTRVVMGTKLASKCLSVVKQVAEWNPQGKRKRGRPINTWKDGIRESMKRREIKDKEFMNRDLWRRKIMSLG
jgi:abortive infection bacteriophage resistance protein